MLRIAICDDETAARDSLRFELEKILYEDSEEIVYEFSSGQSAVRWLLSHPGEIDLLFLDVEMKNLNGMDTARKIREFNHELQIVFVTGYTDYVFEGYRVGALDYIIKPVDPQLLAELLIRVRARMASDKDQFFSFKNTEGIFRMPKEKIFYFYSERRRVIAVTGEGEYPFYGKLDQVQAEIGGSFVRIHQRYLVNAKNVDYIGHDEVRIEGKSLPVSRSLKEEATRLLAEALL